MANLYLFYFSFIPKDYSVSFSEYTDSNPVFLIILIAYALFLGFVFTLMVSSIWDIRSIISNALFVQSGITYTLLAIISSAIGIFLSILLSYPLTTTSSTVRKIYTLIFILFIAAGQLGIHNYLYIRSLGLLNTYFAIIYTHMFHPINVLILGMYYNQKTGNTPSNFGTFIKKSLPAIACLFIANLLIHMDAYTSSLLYMHDPNRYSQTLQIHMGLQSPR